jgi:3-hydroxybutyryl-CoA dehydratase
MCDSLSLPLDFSFDDILEGMCQQYEYTITSSIYLHFISAFDDRSPIHIDEDYAISAGFSGKVMHGSLLNGFLSHFVGMVFPGRRSLLLSVDIRFAKPSFLGDTIRLEAIVNQKLDSRKVILLDVVFHNVTQNCIAARGRVQILMREVV